MNIAVFPRFKHAVSVFQKLSSVKVVRSVSSPPANQTVY